MAKLRIFRAPNHHELDENKNNNHSIWTNILEILKNIVETLQALSMKFGECAHGRTILSGIKKKQKKKKLYLLEYPFDSNCIIQKNYERNPHSISHWDQSSHGFKFDTPNLVVVVKTFMTQRGVSTFECCSRICFLFPRLKRD